MYLRAARSSGGPARVASLLRQGQLALRAGRPDDALGKFGEAYQLEPRSAAALVGIGRSKDALGDTAAAYDAFNAAATLDPRDPEPPYAAGRARLDNDDVRGALPFLDRAVELGPNVAGYIATRAVALAKAGRVEDAIRDYTAAINLERTSAAFYLARAKLLEVKSLKDAAIADYRTVAAITQDPATLEVAQERLRALNSPSARGDSTSASSSVRKRVYLQYRWADDKSIVERLAERLRRSLAGVDVPAAENVSGATNGDVRYFFADDQGLALGVKQAAESALASRGIRLRLQVMPLDGRRFASAREGTVELWLPSLNSPQLVADSRGTDYRPVILWVGDAPDNNTSIRLVLENAGATVISAKSAGEAVQQLERRRFDVVISEGRPELPRAGYELLGRVRATPGGPPVLFYATGAGTPEYRATAENAGAAGSTDNPIELVDMIQARIPGFLVWTGP